MELPGIARMRSALPQCCGIAGGRVFDPGPSGFAAEEGLASGFSAKRRLGFRSGRYYARRALSEIGCQNAEILCFDERDPRWPDGAVGSISHSAQHSCAVTAPSAALRSIGVDVEDRALLPKNLASLICEEQNLPADAALASELVLAHFVAKEAFYKCVFPIERTFMDFSQVRIVFSASGLGFSVLRRMDGSCRFGSAEGYGWCYRNDDILLAAYVIEAL